MKRLLPFIIPLIVLCAIGCVCAPAAAAEEEAKPWVSPPSPVEAEVSWTVGNHGVPLAPFDSPPSPVEVEMPWTLQRISDADDSEADMTTTEGVSTAATAEEEVKSWVSPRHVLDVPATTAAAAEGEAKPWVPPPSPVEAEMPWALQLISDADDTEVDTTTTEGVPSAATAEEKEKGKEVKPWVPPPSPVEAEVLWTLRGIGDADGSLVDMNTFKGLSTAVNFTWVLLATVLVFIMQAGFGLLGGFLEARHMLNYLCQTFLDTTLAGLVFWIWGFALMFGGSGYLGAEAGNPAIGYSGWILYWGAYDVHTIMLWMFQMVFLTKAVVIPVGAITGRCRFPAYLIHACFIAGIVYPIFGHWVWGGGWLGTLPIGSGALDFAGSGVVHAVGGIMGFVGALLLGPRKGKFNPDGTPNDMPPHNMTYVVLGT
ncbi:MAG: ammonium transporter, partial [Candidatus Brocadiales bacterium]